jgi:hypothetical protein
VPEDTWSPMRACRPESLPHSCRPTARDAPPLQGSSALGSYQAGGYEPLAECRPTPRLVGRHLNSISLSLFGRRRASPRDGGMTAGAIAESGESRMAVISFGRAARLPLAAILVVTTLFVSTPLAGADERQRPPPVTERADLDSVSVQPRAKQFASPYKPDVSGNSARDVDALYRQLINQQPAITLNSPGSGLPSDRK